MDLKQVFDEIFQAVISSAEKNLEANKKNTLPDSTRPECLKGSGAIDFDFELDKNGNYHYKTEEYGAGVTIHCTAWITDPDATYSVSIKSSDGGGGHWENVHVNQKLKFDLQTSFWHKTKITVDGHASVSNKKGHGKIEYNY